MNEVTRLLNAIDSGSPQAAKELMPLVYDELRLLAAKKMAQEKPAQTLNATGLVHEAYLRLLDQTRYFDNGFPRGSAPRLRLVAGGVKHYRRPCRSEVWP